jgi:hypothetical protein
MFIVRNSFIAKPGMASKLAALLKEVAPMLPNGRVLTDITGEFNRVVFEWEAANIGEFEARLQQYGTDPELKKKMQGYTDLWLTGSREIFRVA